MAKEAQKQQQMFIEVSRQRGEQMKITEKAQQYEEAKYGEARPRCQMCGQPKKIVWVHGHGQCTYCKTNIMPCCDGEVCY